MKYLKAINELKGYEFSSNLEKRKSQIISIIDNIKEILIPFHDYNHQIVWSSEIDDNLHLIANCIYDKDNIKSYYDFIKNKYLDAEYDKKDISDIFFFVILFKIEKINKNDDSTYSITEELIECLNHIESYMLSFGFKTFIQIVDRNKIENGRYSRITLDNIDKLRNIKLSKELDTVENSIFVRFIIE